MNEVQSLDDVFPLVAGRAHEVSGAGSYAFAAMLAGQLGGAILWIQSRWQSEGLHPFGLKAFYNPARAVIVKCKDQFEILGAAEDALRSGATSLVIAELAETIDFRQGRRLQLAASEGKVPGLFIVRHDAANNAVHTRWHCTPIFDGKDSTHQRWSLIKNKIGTLNEWDVRWDAKTRRVIVVSEIIKQSRFKAQTG